MTDHKSESSAKEDESKLIRFEERVASAERRLDDMKWFIGGALSLVTLVFGLVTAATNLHFDSEKSQIEAELSKAKDDLQIALNRSEDRNISIEKEIREDNKQLAAQVHSDLAAEGAKLQGEFDEFRIELSGKQQPSPDVEPEKSRGIPLRGEKLPAHFYFYNGQWYIQFHLVLVNSTRASSGPISVKFYTQDDLPLFTPNTDEPLPWRYEFFGPSSSMGPGQILPGLVASDYEFHFTVAGNSRPQPREYPVLLKIFYGGDFNSKVVSVPFTVQTD